MGHRHWLIRLLLVISAIIAVWGLGFLWFFHSIGQLKDVEVESDADGIVVLAGGVGRIAAGIDLLRAGRGRRLLISGVDPNIESDVIFSAIGNDGTAAECCVDLGRTALDTAGNADEALAWAQDLGFKSLLVVTADYHMPRSLAEFRCRGTDIHIYPLAVRAERSLRTLALEYSKYAMRLITPCHSWGGR